MNKEKHGEVFTPRNFAEEMINRLPGNIWSNSSLKWLDPCAGHGIFMELIKDKLNKGLKNKIKNDKEREKHILNNMLYQVEINKNSIKILKQKFNTKNIINYDFLKDNIIEKLNNKFDIIIGNPPYNLDGTKTSGRKNVYALFGMKCLDMLEKNGYLLFVHPPGYRKNIKLKGTNLNLNNIYTSYDIKFIKMYNMNNTNKIFNVIMNVDYFLIKKQKIKNKTEIIDTLGNKELVKIKKDDFIPNFGFNILQKLKLLVNKYGNIKIYNTSELHATNRLSDGTYLKNNKGKYKNIHLIRENDKLIYKSKKKHTFYDKKKIFINCLGKNYVFYDNKGEFGATEQQLLIIKPSQIYLKFFSSKLFLLIVEATKITGNNLNRNLDIFLPDFNKNKNLKDNNDIYRLLKLKKNDIRFINSF